MKKDIKFTVKENLAVDSFLIISDTPFPVVIIENKFRPTSENKQNAELICEAFNVANQTGLTPSQLQSELEKAKELLHESKLQIEYLNQKFTATGTSNSILSRLTTFLEGSGNKTK